MSRSWRRKTLIVLVHCVASSPSSSNFFGHVPARNSRFVVIQIIFKLWIAFCLMTMCFHNSMSETVNSTEIQNLTIGFLSSFKYGPGKLSAGAMTIAVEHVNNRSDILPNHRLQFVFHDTGEPKTSSAIRKMTELKEKEDVVAFIGPDHICDCEALVAAAWNLPMITYDCRDQKVSNKKIYPTFARTIPPSKKVSKSVVALLEFFNWKKFVLVVSNNTSDLQAEEALKLLMSNRSMEIIKRYDLPADYRTKDIQYIIDSIEDSYRSTRVYVLLADEYAMIDFAREMYKLHSSSSLNQADYVIILVEEEYLYDPNYSYQFMRKVHEAGHRSNVNTAPFRNVLIITPFSENYEAFADQVRNYTSSPPFNVPRMMEILARVPHHAAFIHDAVMIYARAVTAELAQDGSARNGTAIIQRIKGKSYLSVLGYSMMIDDNGDAEGNFTLLSLKHLEAILPVGKFISRGQMDLPELRLAETIEWISGSPPPQEPECGFKNDLCNPDWKTIVICTVSAVVFFIASGLAFRHYSFEHKLACLLWKVDMKDVVLLKPNANAKVQNGKIVKNIQGFERSRFNNFKDRSGVDPVTGRLLNRLGFYKGNVVYIKPVYKKNIDLTRGLRMEMIQIREMRQENINPFIGACVDHPNISILTLFCARGSLMDVLKNEDINLDSVFVASLVADLIKGMCYIHESEIGFHGNLKSTNCLVDSRWVLQLTDFGLHEFKSSQDLPAEERVKRFKGFLWRAPELLRNLNPPTRGTQKGDVYSFGIILHEILARQGPWGFYSPLPETVEDIVDRIINPQSNGCKIHRPSTQGLVCPDFVVRCMEDCWDEDPDVRPDFRFIGVMLRDMLLEVKTNIFDNMIAIMEKYACNLEGLVEERTQLLMEEKKKTENLLLRMLPKPVAEQLKRGERVEAESFDCVTIYFSDIVGFTALSAVSTPLQVVDLLNDLYTCFDSIIGNYDVYKVETIGDAYMVVSGLPIRNGDNHAVQIVSMALHLLCAIQNFKIPHSPGERLKLRIGIHSGPCVAGVVGLKMPRYCLFGDTVNTASRMESTGEALKIHVSSACKEILDRCGDFELEERGLTQVKGKGAMRTYWLLGKKTSDHDLLRDMENIETLSTHTISMSLDSQYLIAKDAAVCNETPKSPKSELSLLLGNGHVEGMDCSSAHSKRLSNFDTYTSCLNVYHEYKSTIREMRRDGRSLDLGYRSTPMIAFNRLSPRHSSLKGPQSLETASVTVDLSQTQESRLFSSSDNG